MHGQTNPPSSLQSASLPFQGREADENGIDLRAALRILRRRKWTVIWTTLIVVALALLALSQLSKRYSAEALVVVDQRDSQLVGFDGALGQGFAGATAVDTEVEIAQSGKVLQRAAAELDLVNAPEFQPRRSWLEVIGIGRDQSQPQASDGHVDFAALSPERQGVITERLLKSVEVRRRGLTNIISIRATAASAQQAADWANAVATAYLEEQISSRLDSTERAVTFLRNRVGTLSQSITDTERQIDDFVSTKLQELGSPAARDLLARIAAETKSRQATNATLMQVQDAFRRQDYATLATLSGQPDIASQRETLLAQLKGPNQAAHLVDAKQRLAELDAMIKDASTRRMESLQADISLSSSRTSTFRQQLDTTLSDQQLPNEVTTELYRLQRDVETRRTLYGNFLQRLQQVEQQTDFNAPDSRVISYAAPPASPTFPPTRMMAAGSLFFAFAAGIGLALLRENFIGGITDAEQLENITGIPAIASIPMAVAPERPELSVVERPLSALAEAIRRIRIGVDNLTPRGKRCIFITSALPRAGKTTIALALARQFALTGSSTLLIDADLRHPSVHKLLGGAGDDGDSLARWLAKPQTDDDAEQLNVSKEEATGLHLILGAEASAVATDALLMSSRFESLVAFARNTYDVVVIDTPPVGLVVDPVIIARYCDLGIFVAHYDVTSPQQARTSIRDLARSSSASLCAVLNQVSPLDASASSNEGKYRDYYS